MVILNILVVVVVVVLCDIKKRPRDICETDRAEVLLAFLIPRRDRKEV